MGRVEFRRPCLSISPSETGPGPMVQNGGLLILDSGVRPNFACRPILRELRLTSGRLVPKSVPCLERIASASQRNQVIDKGHPASPRFAWRSPVPFFVLPCEEHAPVPGLVRQGSFGSHQ